MTDFQIAVLFGGPSSERGISINSARSICDQLRNERLTLRFFYITPLMSVIEASRSMLYQNTPDDFDFRLKTDSFYVDQVISLDEAVISWKQVDLVFPAGHGSFFEDGTLASRLEAAGIPFVGTPAKQCLSTFDKAIALEKLDNSLGQTHPRLILRPSDVNSELKSRLAKFKADHCNRSLVVKPCQSGSSIGVAKFSNCKKASKHIKALIKQGFESLLVEPNWKSLGWREFTICVVESSDLQPVPLLPIEVDCKGIFNYRKKYLPSNEVSLNIPAEFEDDTIDQIRSGAVKVFQTLGMRDFGRIDGWVGPKAVIRFSDFNIISGMEQNSFFFLQFAHLGFGHREALLHVIDVSCRRHGLSPLPVKATQIVAEQPIDVLFGGITSERHVSVQSGTNVWLKLRQTNRWRITPVMLSQSESKDYVVREIPYAYCLFHTTEDIERCCQRNRQTQQRLSRLCPQIIEQLNSRFPVFESCVGEIEVQRFDDYLLQCQDEQRFVFLALHGGDGENGVVQGKLLENGVAFNNSGPAVSALCSDKSVSNQFIDRLKIRGVRTARRIPFTTNVFSGRNAAWFETTWVEWKKRIGSNDLLIKPTSDGCSTGVARLADANELKKYLQLVSRGASEIPPGTLKHHPTQIQLPTGQTAEFMIEEYISTVDISVKNMELEWDSLVSDWVEITVGVFERNNRLYCMNPTVAVREGNVLSLEEKFQAGTGVNLTPPPEDYVSRQVVQTVKFNILRLANSVGLQGFARVDAFLNCRTSQLIIIELNTLPGMTPATAIFHQSIAENPPIFPAEFLELAVIAGQNRSN